jgi:hypothetical protein
MGRSFRVAEQFVLARAAAVIVHSSGMKEAAQQRGALAESIFLIPDPLPTGEDSPLLAQPLEQDFLQRRFGIPTDRVSFLVPQFATSAHTELSAEQKSVLESFALARAENLHISLLYGKTLLAADVPSNRDVSPDGRGCLWFEGKNPRDLAFRISFIQRNPSFRAALASAGRLHVLETRSTAVIGRQYREAYNYAFGRKRFTGPSTGMASLQPAANWA